jgi:hypothetical protein
MDAMEFHQLMRDKYAEQQRRHLRRLRRWILCSAALVAFWSSFVLAYIRYAGN